MTINEIMNVNSKFLLDTRDYLPEYIEYARNSVDDIKFVLNISLEREFQNASVRNNAELLSANDTFRQKSHKRASCLLASEYSSWGFVITFDLSVPSFLIENPSTY
jgi:hypothetical protein